MENNNMSDERNFALSERDVLVNNYLRGLHDSVPIGKEYARELQELKKLLAKILPYYAKSEDDISISNEKKRIQISIIGIVGWIILYIVFPNSSFLLRTIGMIALVVAFYQTTQNAIWTVVPLTIHFSIGFLRFLGEVDRNIVFEVYIIFIILLFYLADTLKNLLNKIRLTAYQKKLEEKLKKQQNKLKSLIPSMHAELKELQDNWFKKYKHILRSEDQERYADARELFPPAFWWETPLETIKPLAVDVFGDSLYDTWETKLVKRKEGNEFQATDEYSPLFFLHNENNQMLMESFRKEMQCEVYDAISRYVGLEGSIEHTVQYQTYKHNTIDRIRVELSVMGIARLIDDSYNSGNLSSADYKELTNAMFWLGNHANDYINKKETLEYINYIPVRTHTNLWTGQFMIMNWKDKKGKVHCAIRQYYCQLPHLLKNIKALYGMPISVIDYDPFTCNPYFLTYFYAAFPYCL